MKQSYTYTSEFRDELEEQRLSLLRRRFLWYCGVIIGLSVLSLVIGLAVSIFASRFKEGGSSPLLDSPAGMFAWVVTGISTLAYVLAFSWVYRNPQKKDQVFRIAFWLIVVSGALSLMQGPVTAVLMKPGAGGQVRGPGVVVSTNDSGQVSGFQVGPNPESFGLSGAKPASADAGKPEPVREAASAEVRADRASDGDAEDGSDSARDASPAAAGAATGKPGATVKVPGVAGAAVVTASGLWSVFVSHFFACCFLPWTPRESLKPIVPLLILNAVILLFYIVSSPIGIPVAIALSPLVAAPGVGICWWRGSKIRDTFTLNVLKGRYSEIKRELVDARRIHESLFPGPFEAGGVALDYRYEPMRQIGGDYLYARRIGPADGADSGKEYTHVVIVDVTGHGISAALTVNRLHGEIDRQLGEHPNATPAEILSGLNKYLHHTLANHSVYATALCMRVDAGRDELTWASAGHPPAFLRGADGTVDQLDSTTMVLGACKGDDFDANEQRMRFARGDSVIAYTDGAIEARNAQGRMLGVTGMRSMVASIARSGGVDASALDPLIRAVDEHRFGPIQDDTLLVELSRPVRGA